MTFAVLVADLCVPKRFVVYGFKRFLEQSPAVSVDLADDSFALGYVMLKTQRRAVHADRIDIGPVDFHVSGCFQTNPVSGTQQKHAQLPFFTLKIVK